MIASIKFISLCFLSVVIYSCSKEHRITCVKDKSSLKRIVFSIDKSIDVSFANDNTFMVTQNDFKKNTFKFWRVNTKNQKVYHCYVENLKYGINSEIKYNSAKNFRISSFNRSFNEYISITRIDYIKKVEVSYELPPSKRRVRTFYYTINEKTGDTIGEYFYYNYTNNKFTLKGNNSIFKEKAKIDSLIFYFANSHVKHLVYDSPEEHQYFPDFSNMNLNILKGVTIFSNESKPITGILMCYFNKKYKMNSIYSNVIINGDLLNRISIVENRINKYKNNSFNYDFTKNIFLKQKLIKLEVIEANKDKIVLTNKTKKALKSCE